MAVTLADDKLPELRDRLKSCPRFFKVYCEAQANNDSVVKGFDFLVDSWPDFKTVVTRPNPDRIEYKYINNVYSVCGDSEKALSSVLNETGVVDWTRSAVFVCDRSLFSVVAEVIKLHDGTVGESEPADILTVTAETLNLKPVPEGFKLTSLKPEDAEMVNAAWKFCAAGVSRDYIRAVIGLRPSCCLYDQKGAVVGFALSYHYGALGLLHVFEEYRGKGYAKVIMSQLANKTIADGREAFVIIEESNTVSLKLHEGLGFKTIPDLQVSWISYTPKGKCQCKATCCV